MLLDEPFAGIDPLALLDIQQIIRQLKERGLGIMISDHNVRETLSVCDRAYIICEGRIIEQGPPDRDRSERGCPMLLSGGELLHVIEGRGLEVLWTRTIDCFVIERWH